AKPTVERTNLRIARDQAMEVAAARDLTLRQPRESFETSPIESCRRTPESYKRIRFHLWPLRPAKEREWPGLTPHPRPASARVVFPPRLRCISHTPAQCA